MSGAFCHYSSMNELMLGLFLAGAPAAASPCCPAAAPRFAVAVDNAKEARDNIGHFVSPAVLAASFYGTAVYLGASRKQARWIAAGSTLLLIVVKEWRDESVAGRFGVEEVAIGIGGTAAGLWLAEQLDWAEAKKE